MMRWGAPFLQALLWLALIAAPAVARQEAHIVIDHATGTVLDARDADEPAYPASLTKMMTLYLTFRALKAGKIDLDSRLRVSSRAAAMPPTKLGLNAGSTIAVEDAILGLVTRSANDAAAVLAEGLGGSESRFASLMTRTARELGMKRTIFRNASGLPDAEQRSTARDLARLATRLIVDHPQYYRYFSRRSFVHGGRTFANHNHLMQSYAGMDGLKTGYTRASGFNLAASAVRGGQRLVAVVLGGRTAHARDQRMSDLLDEGFAKLRRERRSQEPLVASLTLPSPPRPELPETRLASFEPSDEADVVAVRETLVASLAPAVVTTDALPPTPEPKAVLQDAEREPARKVKRQQAQTPKSKVARTAKKASKPVAGRSGLPYGVQVGAYRRSTQARLAAKQAVAKAPDLLAGTFLSVSSQIVKRKTLFRATLIGLGKDEADQACRRLKRQKLACLVIRTSPVAVAVAAR